MADFPGGRARRRVGRGTHVHGRPVYESTASIRIDEDPSNVPVLDILETISTGSQVETEMEVLRSRTLAEDVVDSLALQVVLAGPRGVARGEVVERIHVETWAPPGLYRLTREGDVFTGVEESTEADVGSFTIGQPSVLPGVTFMLTPEAAEHAELRVRVQSFEDAVKRLSEAVTVARPTGKHRSWSFATRRRTPRWSTRSQMRSP